MYTLWCINIGYTTHTCMCNAHKTLGLEKLSMTLLIVRVGCILGCLVVINMYTHTYTQIVHVRCSYMAFNDINWGALNRPCILINVM